MKYRALGNTGLEISELGFGAASLGDIYRTIDEAEGLAAVHAAIDGGINYFDVAPLYGFTLAETRLGHALRGHRDQVILATKACRDGFDNFDFSAERVAASIDASLQRLQTEYVDVFQIHDVEFAEESQILNETLPAARKVQQSGKARFVGITGLPVRYLRHIAEQAELDTMMSWGHYNLVEDEMAEELTEFCQQRGVGLLNASPLLQGLLTEYPPPDWHRSPNSVKAVAPKLADLCRKAGINVATVALNFAVDYPHVASTVVGMSTPAKVADNLAALQAEIPAGLLDDIEQLVAPIKNRMWFEGRPENNIPPSDPNRWVPEAPDQTHS